MALSGSFNTTGYKGRCWKFSWTATQNVGNNTSTISYKVEAIGGSAGWYMTGPCKVVVAGHTVYHNTGRWKQYKGTIKTGSITINHNSNGTASFSASISSAIYYYADGTGNGSGTWSLNTIPRASQPSVNSYPDSATYVYIGDSITIHMNKKANFTHKVTATFGNKSEVVTNSCVDNVVWSGFSVAKYAGQIPNSTSGTLTFTVQTMSGGNIVGTKSVSVIAYLRDNIVPSCSIGTLTNTNNTFNCYAKLLSGIKIRPYASGAYGSSISTLTIEVTSKSSKSASSGVEYTFDAFDTTGYKTIKVIAKDSRGRYATASQQINVLDYSYPIANISASRGNGDTVGTFVPSDVGVFAKITASGRVSSISGNILTSTLQYRISGSSSWNTLPSTPSGVSFSTTQIIQANDTDAYDIRLIVKDKAGKSSTAMMTLSNGFATIDYKNGGDGIAFGKTANRTGFDCAMLMRILNKSFFMGESNGEYGQAAWFYNNAGTQVQVSNVYGATDGFHISVPSGKKGFLQGTWSGSLSDRRMKIDIEPIAANIIRAVGDVPFMQFRMSADGYDHDELYVGIMAQDLEKSFARYEVSDKLLMLDRTKLNPDDNDEYFCIEYTHFLIVRLLYDELQMQDMQERLNIIEHKLGIR